MRKITQETTSAFFAGDDFSKDNTRVYNKNGVVYMELHGNCIAKRKIDGQYFEINNQNWKTNTTKERLNGLLSEVYNGIYQKKGVWYFNNDGKEMKNATWYMVKM